MMCVANLHSLPWNFTSKAHKIRTTLKRRWIFKRASGNCCLHDAGKSWPPQKQQWRQQQSSVYTSENEALSHKEKDPSKGQNLDYDSWMTYLEKTFFKTLIFKYACFDTMISAQWRSESNVLGCYTSSIVNGGVCKIPKLTGKRIHV